jgi:hypothetical protein
LSRDRGPDHLELRRSSLFGEPYERYETRSADVSDRRVTVASAVAVVLLLASFTRTVAAAAVSLGAYNHFVVIPWMSEHPGDDRRSVRIRNTATGEAILLLVVIVVTAFLVGASSQS